MKFQKRRLVDVRKMRDDQFNEVYKELNTRFKRTKIGNIEYYVTILEDEVNTVLKVINNDYDDFLILSEEIPLILNIEVMGKEIIKSFDKLIEQARYELEQESKKIDYALENLSKLDFR